MNGQVTKVKEERTKTQWLVDSVQKALDSSTEIAIFPHGAKDSEELIALSKGKAYIIMVEDDKVTGCTCPHHEMRNVVCKHMVKASIETGKDLSILSTLEIKIETKLSIS